MVVQPAMLHCMETVPLSIRDTKRLEVAEIKMCRWALGHTLENHVRNEYIRERMRIVSIGVRCKEIRLRWFGHVKRRDEVYVGRRVMDMRLPGRKKHGSPKLRWMDCVRRDLDSIIAKEEDTLD
ncbi:uncharacterized protein LOC125026999 [Penaeus chinensis]|uniref:uncharacterized protein LOC125026999 n=1 Tax=Penaeus chinensis TaxID=139456 RepID=UPI001FB60E37|nr:uncharacterized protein LOC125026999 [Penaeus chinensis]